MPSFSEVSLAEGSIGTGRTLLDGLLAYWKLDTTSWLDSSGNGNTLNNSGGVTLGTGKIGSGSASFVGSQFLYFNSFPALGTRDFSFSTWIKPIFGGGFTSIGSLRPADIASLNYFGFGNQNGNFYFYNAGFVSNNSGVLIEGIYQHIAVIKLSGFIQMYVNGSLISTDADSGNYISSNFNIGANGDGSISYIGDIDEYGAWNRALTGLEITSLYNAGAGKSYPF
jgi:hypothetical protein